MQPDTGSNAAALVGRDVWLVRTQLVRKIVDTRERRTLEQPDTNISWEVEMLSLLHLAPTTLATDMAAAMKKQSATPK